MVIEWVIHDLFILGAVFNANFGVKFHESAAEYLRLARHVGVMNYLSPINFIVIKKFNSL